MVSGHLPPTHPTCPPAPLPVPRAVSLPQPLWTQLDPMARQQLAQHLAQLIWRIRRQAAGAEGGGRD
jgi:hypothetical protein